MLINEQRVRAAITKAQEKGLQIVHHTWGDYRTCACPITAVLERYSSSPVLDAAIALDVTTKDVSAFVLGFDTPDSASPTSPNEALGAKLRRELGTGTEIRFYRVNDV